jgi:hypothetical protein
MSLNMERQNYKGYFLFKSEKKYEENIESKDEESKGQVVPSRKLRKVTLDYFSHVYPCCCFLGNSHWNDHLQCCLGLQPLLLEVPKGFISLLDEKMQNACANTNRGEESKVPFIVYTRAGPKCGFREVHFERAMPTFPPQGGRRTHSPHARLQR